jgi:MFS family permease
MSMRALARLKARPAALVAIGYMFVTNLDSIFVIPLLPVLHGGAPAAVARDIALALSLRLGASLLLSLLLPALAPRAGNARLLLASSLLKAAAFASILAIPAPASLWCFALLAGAGTGTLRPAVRAVIADETRGHAQALAFQALFLAMNLAFVLGPLMAEAAVRLELVAAGVIAVTALELCAGLAALRLVPVRKSRSLPNDAAGGMLRAARNLERGVWLLMGQTLLSYAAVGFLIASLVLYQSINPPLGAWRNALLSAEGLAVIAVQLALMPLFTQLPRARIHGLVALSAGVGLVLCFSTLLPLAFLGLIVFALAECLAMPVAQLELSERAPAQNRRAIFALAMVAAALGEIGGSWLAWGVVRAQAAGMPGAMAAQGAGLLIGCGLAAVAWALARRAGQGARTATGAARLAEGRR